MCIGIPLQVLEAQGSRAQCRGRLGTVPVDVTLLAPVVPGEWLLTSLGHAHRRLAAEEAARIDRALDALDAVRAGRPVDVASFFPDLVDREPELPEHLRPAQAGS